MTNSEARKRQQAASNSEPGSHATQAADWATGTTPDALGPQTANLDVDAIRDRAEFWASRDPEVTQRGLYDRNAVAFAREVLALLAEVDRLSALLAAAEDEKAEQFARLTQREAAHAERLAEQATEGDTGVCRTCAAPIWFEEGEVGHRPRVGWSDRIKRGGDSVVCFKAVGYRHVPLVGRERGVWDAATKAAEGRLERVRALTLAWQHDAPDFAPVFYERVLAALDEGPR